MKIKLPDGAIKEFDVPVTPREVAQSISDGLARATVGARVNGELVDADRPIETDAALNLVTKPRKNTPVDQQDPDALYLLRHSCAHVMAEAIQSIWPEAQLAYGPPLDNGFYYDIRLDQPISSDDFEKIEGKMAEIVKEDRPFTRVELPKQVGLKWLAAEDNKYKVDNANRAIQAGSALLSWYFTGDPARDKDAPEELAEYGLECVEEPDWSDLCMGPHVPSTGAIGAFKLTSVAQSHWHGDVNQDAFQRVYGTAFFTKRDLEDYLQRLEEARQRDHRVIGQKLGLFTIDEQVGQGLVLWKPRGAMVRNLLEDFLKQKLLEAGYELVYTPHIGKIDLYQTSGHYPYYSHSQFPPVQMRDSEEQYLLKPMNCPHHCRIYGSDMHSYRDLPIRLAEFGTVYRWEQSGELTGMTRVRGFTQDDAHVFCTPDQVKDEVRQCIELVQFVFNSLGFENVSIYLSLRDPAGDKYVGDPRDWDRAERELRELLDEMDFDYVTEEGEAAFYGPKVDFKVKDVIGREWQLGTVQLDYNLPKRFELSYVGKDNQPHQPVMIHRAPFGSMERFMGILIEHYAGAFPLWLSPEQMRVLTISEKFTGYGQTVTAKLRAAGFRATLDDSDERVNAKVRIAQDMKVNYMLVVGGRDEQAGTVSVRDRTRGDLGAMPLDQFIDQAGTEQQTRGKQIVGQASIAS
jgi:threonyl-tRNA synthetase